MRLYLYRGYFLCTKAWAVEPGDAVNAYIEMSVLMNRHVFFTFQVSVANKTFSSRNPFKVLLRALESETIGMAKYDALKEAVRDNDTWKYL